MEDSIMTDVAGDGEESSPGNSHHESHDDTPVKKDPKDPSRPRRKKARRACFACQRAHLTCGDERPCLRCVKRGLQDQCHDGLRKKAKYLHDAPPEALVPGMGGSYQPQQGNAPASTEGARDDQNGSSIPQASNAYFSNRNSSSGYLNIAQKGSNDVQGSQAVDPQLGAFAAPSRDDFSVENQRIAAMPTSLSMQDQSTTSMPPNGQFNMPFDPTDPHFFNFDISGLNFDSHYGAHEFAMLGHMSSGAYESPSDTTLLNQLNYDGSNAYSPNNSFQYNIANNNFQKWSGQQNQKQPRQPSGHSFLPLQEPVAFTIGEGSASIASASPNTTLDHGYVSSPASVTQKALRRSQADVNMVHAYKPGGGANPFAVAASSNPNRRRKDPSLIYRSVKEPYSYTTGFHNLKACIVRRFSKDKTLRIAKALASIRPSFISCTRDLSHDDLVFMEKGFQRNLLLYDDYINAYGCPTLICRRTGEVAAASKEFSLLSGWRRDILLGKEPNLNVNYGTSTSVMMTGDASGTTTRGAATPVKGTDGQPGRPQPVFLAELLDDDTAVQFYDDFAKMAFGDSRGQVTRRGKILKYKTKDSPGWGRMLEEGAQREESHGEGKGIGALGDKDGKVDVMICHTVKRDTFDIPMMIIINFLPVIP